MPLRLDVAVSALRPIDALGELACPTMVIGGALDQHTTAAETRRIYGQVGQPKALWIVDGAAHVDFHAHARDEYERRIAAFFAKHLVQ